MCELKKLKNQTVQFVGFDKLKNNECWVALLPLTKNLVIVPDKPDRDFVMHVHMDADQTVDDPDFYRLVKNHGSLDGAYLYVKATGTYVPCTPRYKI